MKQCPKCNVPHAKPGTFCSRQCSNSRVWSEEDKKRKSESAKTSSKVKDANSVVRNRKKTPKFKNPKCKWCGSDYFSNGSRSLFCSDVCKSANWSQAHLKAYASGRNYVAGGTSKWFEVITTKGPLKVQGSYEVRTVAILERWKNEGLIFDWEYTSDRFPYVGPDGKLHSYLLDFKIFEDGKLPWYLEVKGYATEKDEAKWLAVRALGHTLQVWFNQDIQSHENF